MDSCFYVSLFSILLFCHVAALFTYSVSSMKPSCHDYESSALLQFKDSIIVDYRSFNCYISAHSKIESWKLVPGQRGDCCSWEGVECDVESSHVIGIDLSSSCLTGSINSNSTLFHLVHLQSLNLAYNNFSYSQIPSQVGLLSSLTRLNLSFSSFSGQIPRQIFNLSSLISLDLSDYDYVGSHGLKLHKPGLKDLVQRLPNLKELHLSAVNISSGVPVLLSNVSSLESLRLDSCGLHGKFPMSIFQLPNIKMLDLSFNVLLEGYLPNFQSGSPLKSLRLSSTKFVGELPSSIGNLAYLEELVISRCNFTGELPSSIGKLVHLKELDISYCNFTGQLPTSFGKLVHLEQLHISYCKLTGKLHSSIGNFVHLKELEISHCNFLGQIPSSFGNLTKLYVIDLGHNQLTGPIPSSLGNLTQLEYINLRRNQLSGQIPFQIFNLKSLSLLLLSSNELHGSIPSNFSQLNNLQVLDLYSNKLVGSMELIAFFQLKNLWTLTLSFNNLSLFTKGSTNSTIPNFSVLGLATCNLSEVPSFLQNQSQLLFLDLSSNNIQGRIPSWMYNVSTNTLDYLNLSNNLLTGFQQDPVVFQWAQIRTLDLRSNLLQGSLPLPPSSTTSYLISHNRLVGEVSPLLCNLSALETLDLSFNNLSGELPHYFGNFSDSLSLLDLRRNNFNGSIPSTWSDGCKLRMISISYNQLQGQVPRSFVKCSSLELVDFGNNHITDSFPSWLGDLAELRILILRSNKFYGVIEKPQTMGFPNLRIIDLSHNGFSGKLPSSYFEIWNTMKTVNSNHMEYMGRSIRPSKYYFFTHYGQYDYSMTMYNKGLELEYAKIPDIFTAIEFSYNKFEGEIPDIIGKFEGLYLLNLSNNFLIGHIPSTLANLKALECLDLSQNKLSGQLPPELTYLTYLSSFNVSYNQLEGPIPRGKQFDTFESNQYEGNKGLCGAPLKKKCENFESSPPHFSTCARDEDTGSLFKFNWLIVSMGYGSGLIIGVVAGNEVTRRKHDLFMKILGRKQQRRRNRS